MKRNNLVVIGIILAGIVAGVGLSRYFIRRRQENTDEMLNEGEELIGEDEVIVLVERELPKPQSLLSF